jgi:hypothetical protein
MNELLSVDSINHYVQFSRTKMEPYSSLPREPHISFVRAGSEIGAKYLGGEIPSIKNSEVC